MPSPTRSRSKSDQMVNHMAALCADVGLELDALTSDAKTAIRANAVDRKALADLAADLVKFRMTGSRHCRIGLCGGKLVALPLA